MTSISDYLKAVVATGDKSIINQFDSLNQQLIDSQGKNSYLFVNFKTLLSKIQESSANPTPRWADICDDQESGHSSSEWTHVGSGHGKKITQDSIDGSRTMPRFRGTRDTSNKKYIPYKDANPMKGEWTCRNWLEMTYGGTKGVVCKYGDRCNFRHSLDEDNCPVGVVWNRISADNDSKSVFTFKDQTDFKFVVDRNDRSTSIEY
jgi:hypothetical protein